MHILDLVQNSIEAGAAQVEVFIEENIADDYILVVISDNGKGMDEHLLRQVCDPFVTSRTTRKVGLGLPLIKMSAEHCEGYIDIKSKPQAGTKVEFKFKYSHWDRPPLGDMAQTIRTIIVGSPNLQFNYIHKVNGKVFHFESNEVRKTLDDVPISHPEVLTWLAEYLTEGIANLYGG